jgi:hypothetical protein
MPRLNRPLAGAEPVDQHGASTGPAVTLPAGTDFAITVRKLNRPSDSFGEIWSEIRVSDRLYRVPLRLLDASDAA